jgi:hypothetical protein
MHTATNVEMFVNVNFTVAGTYWIEVHLDNTLKLTYPLRIGQTKTPAPPPA